MKQVALVVGISVYAIVSSHGATVSYSFWAYDQRASNSPYYSHYRVTTENPDTIVVGVDLLDRGWGYSTTGSSSYHIFTSIETASVNPKPLRSIGWHQFEFILNDLTKTASILMDGNMLQTNSYTYDPSYFRVVFHDYYGGTQETVIDDFEYRVDGTLVYQQGFESSTLDSNWSIGRLDAGTYVTSGDPSTPHTGSGALAIGATTGGNLTAMVTFVPEPSSIALFVFSTLGLLVKRKR